MRVYACNHSNPSRGQLDRQLGLSNVEWSAGEVEHKSHDNTSLVKAISIISQFIKQTNKFLKIYLK